MKSNVRSSQRRALRSPNPSCPWPKLNLKLQQMSFLTDKENPRNQNTASECSWCWTPCRLPVLLAGPRLIPCVRNGSRSCSVRAASPSELHSQKHGVISGKPQQREGETHTEGERGEEWNKPPLTMTDIYRTTCFWLQSISLFISDLSQMAQHTGAYCRTEAAGPTEVGCDQRWANSHKLPINSSLSAPIRLCAVASDRGEHRRVKNKETKVVWMLIFS